MGVSTDALLFYGYIWNEDVELLSATEEDGDPDDWVELLARQRGIPDPWDNYPVHGSHDEQQAWRAGTREAREVREEAERKIAAEYAVTIDHHGSASWRCPLVCVKSTLVQAGRGFPKDVTTMALGRNAEWDAELDRFLADTGISARDAEGPGWFLASWWDE